MKPHQLIAFLLFNSFTNIYGQVTWPIDENFDLGNVFTSTGAPGWNIDSTLFVSWP